MPEKFVEAVRRWDDEGHLTNSNGTFNELHERIDFLRRTHFDEYIPTLGSEQSTDFETRLEEWIDGIADDADRRILAELVPEIIFFSRDDFTKLHQVALRGPIARWIINELDLKLDDPTLDARIQEEVHTRTWFCAVSDSMQISDFHHANHIGGINYRPDMRTLARFGDIAKLQDFMSNPGAPHAHRKALSRIVLLEDFIGSGAQLNDAQPLIEALCRAGTSILLSPLIICPGGAGLARQYEANQANFHFDPVMELPQDAFLTSRTVTTAGSFKHNLKELLQKLWPVIVGNNAAHPRPYGPFGFQDTGSLVVLYSNTPANTLPAIQHRSNSWKPLFPRSARVK
jgi:hypothetical protein